MDFQHSRRKPQLSATGADFCQHGTNAASPRVARPLFSRARFSGAPLSHGILRNRNRLSVPGFDNILFVDGRERER